MLLLRVQPNEIGDVFARKLARTYCEVCRELGYSFRFINPFEVELPDVFSQEIGRHRFNTHFEICVGGGAEMLRTYDYGIGKLTVIDHTRNNEHTDHQGLFQYFCAKYSAQPGADIPDA